MANFLLHPMYQLAEHTEWIDKSQLHCRVRQLGDLDKIVVDVTEYSYGRPSVARSKSLARRLADEQGARNFAAVVLFDQETDRKVFDANGDVHRLRIRLISYAFEGPTK